MGVLYKWLVNHPNVKIELIVREGQSSSGGTFTRDDMTMYYNGTFATRCINERYLKGDGYFRYKLNDMYRQCGGKFFVDELDLSVREYNVLCSKDIVEVYDFVGLTIGDLLNIDGVGPKMVSDILIELCKKGLLLRKKDCRPVSVDSVQKNFDKYKEYEIFIPEFKYEGDYIIHI